MRIEVDRALEILGDHPLDSAVLCDFDGTLSEIVPDPAAARPVPGAVAVLHRLVPLVRVVALVSGRPASFLAEHLEIDAPGVHPLAFGLYGLEQIDADGNVVAEEAAERYRAPLAEAAAEAAARTPPGASVESKGLGVTLHWRNAPDRAGALGALAEELALRHGLRLRAGKMSAELSPPVSHDKGDVVARLAAGCRAACFIGDDRGDLAAFGALDGLAGRSGLEAVRVAVESAEAPPELIEAADLVLAGPAAVVDFLERLAERAGA